MPSSSRIARLSAQEATRRSSLSTSLPEIAEITCDKVSLELCSVITGYFTCEVVSFGKSEEVLAADMILQL